VQSGLVPECPTKFWVPSTRHVTTSDVLSPFQWCRRALRRVPNCRATQSWQEEVASNEGMAKTCKVQKDGQFTGEPSYRASWAMQCKLRLEAVNTPAIFQQWRQGWGLGPTYRQSGADTGRNRCDSRSRGCARRRSGENPQKSGWGSRALSET
jgi:hypothetical protein